MPGMNGIELATRARALRPGLRTFFASGYADLDVFGTALSEEKPYRLAELAAQVERSLAVAPHERRTATGNVLRQVRS